MTLSPLSPILVRRITRYALTSFAICLGLSPTLFWNFGFHNDYWAWAYDASRCCFGHPETDITIAAGRFLAALALNLQFVSIHLLPDLLLWRLVIVGTTGLLGAYYLYLVSGRRTPTYVSMCLAIGIFVLPTMQLNALWASNFVYFNPPIFLSLLGAHAFLYAEECRKFRDVWSLRSAGVAAFLSALFFYPASATFGLIPAIHKLLFNPSGRARAYAIAAAAGLCTAYVCYYVIQKYVVLPIADPARTLGQYGFELHDNLIVETLRRLGAYLLAASNLWVITDLRALAPTVAVFAVAGAGGLTYRAYRKTASAQPIVDIGLMIAMIGLITAPQLLAQQYATTYRVLLPIGAAVLLFVYSTAMKLGKPRWRKLIAAGLTAIGVVVSFASLYAVAHGAWAEHRSYERLLTSLPKDQFHTIAVLKPAARKEAFGLPLREDFGRLGPISTIGDLLIGPRFRGAAHFDMQSFEVSTDPSASIFLEKGALVLDLFPLYGLPALDLAVRPIVMVSAAPRGSAGPLNAVDSYPWTYWEVWGAPFPVTLALTLPASKMITGYSLGSYEAPDRMPARWELWTSEDLASWRRVDTRDVAEPWQSHEVRQFVLSAPAHVKAMRLVILDAAVKTGVRLYSFAPRYE